MTASCAVYGDGTCDCAWTCRAEWDWDEDDEAYLERAFPVGRCCECDRFVCRCYEDGD